MKKNIIANFIGRFWSILSSFLFIPLYIYFLGIENYSIISFTLVVAGVMAILDAGLTATLSREFALKTNTHVDKNRIFNSLESCYLFITLIIILLVFIFADKIANNWLNLDKIAPDEVNYYLKIIGIGIAFQLLANFYMGGLFGLELQVKANVFQIIWGIVKNVLVVIPIIFLPSLEIFFIWQTISTLIYVIFLRFTLKKSLNIEQIKFKIPKIEKEIIKRVWKFAAGMLLISLISGINTQLDKLVISKFLPIAQLGYYTLAISLAQGIVILVSPISTAILPRFTALYSEKNMTDAANLFHKVFLMVSILIFSFASNIIFNSKDLLWIWTGNIEMSKEAYKLVPFLVIGMSMLALQVIPYNIAVANGQTKLISSIGILSIIITIPGYFILTKYFGATGAAITWGTVQLILTPIFLYFNNKLFIKDKSFIKIIVYKIIFPFAITMLVAFLFSQINIFAANRLTQISWIGISTLISAFFCFIFILKKEDRQFIFALIPENIRNKFFKR